MIHTPVLVNEVVALLKPERGGVFIDATLGFGGHTSALLEKAHQTKAKIRILGIDQDGEALEHTKKLLGDQIEYVHANFAYLQEAVEQHSLEGVDGILMDLGVSSYQIDRPKRGFSFQENGPLDMRMDLEAPLTAAIILSSWSEYQLADLFYYFGEERFSRRIAREIVAARKQNPFKETKQLADFLVHQYPAALRYKHPHPATRVFQALRIEVNKELDVLPQALAGAFKVLNPGGILAVISFHSLEDRIVKQAFKSQSEKEDYVLLTKKPLIATEEEMRENPRSRSAKLRGIQRIVATA